MNSSSRYRWARFLERLSFICEDVAERLSEQGAKDEARVQHALLRNPLA